MLKEQESCAGQSAINYEYNTLMRLLGISVSKHLLDEHFTVVWANEFYYQFIGWPKEEYEAAFHNRCDLYYQNDRAEWEKIVSTVVEAINAKRNGYSLISHMRRKDGSYIWVQFSTAFAEEYVDGFQVAYTVMTNIDNLVRMQKEQSITYDNLPGFVAKYKVEETGLRLLEANGRFHEFFDFPELNGMSSSFSNLDTEKNRLTFEDFFPRMRKGEQVHFTIQARNRSGSNVWLQVNADCVEWVNETPVYLLIYIDITDITEQRELQKELEERSRLLNEALEAAEQANRAKSDFLSRMSHDIRTPMNAIMGMASIATSHIDDKERVLDSLRKINVSANLLLNLINEVLDMSKVESGRIAIKEEEFSLADLLQNLVTIIQPSIMEKQHMFSVHACKIQHELVIGDPHRIEQVFLNILSNAIKYTPDQGQISLELWELPSDDEDSGLYKFIFKDNGYGMKEEFLDKVFIPFERANDDSIHSIQGTGLGMAISQNIIKMMGGQIQVESVYGEGSIFTVFLRLKLQNVTNVGIELPNGLPVLVVDDDQIACETTCEYLEELGFLSEWVLSGKEAVAIAEQAKRQGKEYFAIIVDLRMAGMDGVETTRQIRGVIGADVPIIMLSAFDWTEFEAEARDAGADGFITKPLLKSSLIYAIKRYAMKEEVTLRPIVTIDLNRDFSGKRLLLVEDNELNCEIATEVISRTGITIETARNGQEAIEKFSAAPEGYYCLIFMDLQMPVMGGIEATVNIRGLDRADSKVIPIIAMTANVFSEDISACKDAGMNAHLSKPLEIARIYQVMEQFIEE